jgi:Domain of unknown function (DUF4383)
VRKLLSAESLAGVAGLTFLVLGVCGFVPGAVQDYGALHWWRNGSGADLFGVFQTSILLNLAHIGFGAVALVAGRRAASARSYLTLGGIVIFALGIYRLLIDPLGDSNVVPFDRADVWLHVGLGVAMVYAGLATGLARARPVATA